MATYSSILAWRITRRERPGKIHGITKSHKWANIDRKIPCYASVLKYMNFWGDDTVFIVINLLLVVYYLFTGIAEPKQYKRPLKWGVRAEHRAGKISQVVITCFVCITFCLMLAWMPQEMFHTEKCYYFFLLLFLIFNYLFYFTTLYWCCHTLTWIHHGCNINTFSETRDHVRNTTVAIIQVVVTVCTAHGAWNVNKDSPVFGLKTRGPSLGQQESLR